MTLGLLVKPQVLATSGIIENTNYFDNTDRAFTNKQEVRVDNSIYYRYADDIVVPDFDSNKIDYKLNDIVYRNGKASYINGVSGTGAKQPENYTNIDTSLESNSWVKRYLKIGTFSNGKIEKELTNGDDTYKYTFKNDAGKINTVISALNFGDDSYVYTNDASKSGHYVMGHIGGNACLVVVLKNHGTTTEKFTSNFQLSKPYSKSYNESIMGSIEKGEVLGSDTTVNDTTEYEDSNGKVKLYSYKLADGSAINNTIQAIYQSSLQTTEEKAIVTDNYKFEPKSFIIRGNDLYMRTNKDVVQETIEITEISTKILETLNEIEWGWDYKRPIKSLLPFDNKKYTAIEETNEISFTLKSDEEFDEIALNNVYASNIKIEILDSNNTVLKTINRVPKTLITNGTKEKHFPTISITYLGSFVTTNQKVRITLTPLNGKVILGEGCLGNAWTLGRTEMSFKSSSIDYTPPETDKFGNKTETKDVKVRVLDADVVLDTKHFSDIGDMLLRTSGKKIIYDGSDNFKNEKVDNRRFFTQVMIIGKAKITEQTTRIDADNISDYSDYHIHIEEDI